MNLKKEQYPLSEYEMVRLTELISWAVNGPEHGIITSHQHKEKCKELVKFLNDRGYYPHGQWTL